MQLLRVDRKILIFIVYALMCSVGFANDDLFVHARELQREGKYDEAIDAYKDYLLQPMDAKDISKEQMKTYTDALMQLMNTFQSKGQPEACISALQEVFESSPTLQNECLRDYYSVTCFFACTLCTTCDIRTISTILHINPHFCAINIIHILLRNLSLF